MIELGKNNKLKVISVNGDELLLDAENFGTITTVNNDFIIKYKKDDIVNVFLYPDGDIIKADLGESLISIGELALLKVVALTKIGAFFDIGIDKDLFCPFSEQKMPLVINGTYLVFAFIDEKTNRITATTKIEKFLSHETSGYEINEKVNIIITSKSDLGYTAVVDNKYHGFLYANEVFSELHPGEKYSAYVKKVREDGKIDLKIIRNDHEDIEEFEKEIIAYLECHENKMYITDKSSADEIKQVFAISKKNFKKTLGALYRKKIIIIEDDCITLIVKEKIPIKVPIKIKK